MGGRNAAGMEPTVTSPDKEHLILTKGENQMSAKRKHGTRGFTQAELFRFLDNLRESGAINMYGAPRVMEQQMGLSSKEAKEVWVAWTETFQGENR